MPQYATPSGRPLSALTPVIYPVRRGVGGDSVRPDEAEFLAWQARVPGGVNPYPEFKFYNWLNKQGWRSPYEGAYDFEYQVAIGGGRRAGGGGFIIDFVLNSAVVGHGRLPVEIYGAAFHTAAVFVNPAEQRGIDRIKRELMREQYHVNPVYCDEFLLLNQTDRTMRLTIQGISTNVGP